MNKSTFIQLLFVLITSFSCTNKANKNEVAIVADTTKTIPPAAPSALTITTADTAIIFNEKSSTAITPLSFSFTLDKRPYKFYVYANYLLPAKSAKEQPRKQLNILASVYKGLQTYDDIEDGASLKIEEPLVLNKPLKISAGFIVVNNGKILNITEGTLVLTKQQDNIISGTFSIKGTIQNLTSEKPLAGFAITDGRFEDAPVNVHRITDFNEGWQDGNP